VPYDKLLPPRMHKLFAASLKLTFTRDGDKQIPIVWGSSFNVIVTNTEKIRIQKPNVRSNGKQIPLFAGTKVEEQTELANLRLQAVASLPHLAVFSTRPTTPTVRSCWASGRRTRRPANSSSRMTASRRSGAPSTIWPRKPTSSSSSTPRARRISSASCATWWSGTAWAKASATAC
jgi:hypothetical protein